MHVDFILFSITKELFADAQVKLPADNITAEDNSNTNVTTVNKSIFSTITIKIFRSTGKSSLG